MFSERKFSKDRVIPKGYVELLENRVDILETGLREALLRLNASGGIQLPHSPSSNPPSPTSVNFLDHSHDLTYNITQALKELQSMKVEREKGIYSEHDHESDHDDHGEDSSSHRDSAESTQTVSSVKVEDLATPMTSPSNSPVLKTQFLPSEISQPQPRQYTDNNSNFYQAYYDRQTNPIISAMPPQANAPFVYDELSLSWLDSVALDETYDMTAMPNNDFSLMNL